MRDIPGNDIVLAPAPGVTTAQTVSLHFLGAGGLLFDSANQKLYAANTTATFIWCCLEDAQPVRDIVERLQRTFGLSSSEADTAVAHALKSWHEVGLLDGSVSETPVPAPDSPAPPPLPLARGPTDEFRILDTRFRLRCAPARLRRRVRPMLVPLTETPSGGDLTAVDIELGLCGGRFVLVADRAMVASCERWDEVVPMLKGHVNLLALRHSRDFAAIHAAAVSLGARCVLLPAASGLGKSTLAAALTAAGFPLLGDDTIVLGEETLEARAMPFGICVKSGAWRLLRGRFPSLSRRPKYRRPDGKVVRYLLPRDGGNWASPSFRQAVGWIVFPRRGKGVEAAFRPVPKLDAVSRLLEGFYPLGAGLDARRVDRLVAWLDGIECLELQFASLGDAVRRIRELC